jgi:hypothetical protein
MGVTIRFIDVPGANSVLAWLRARPEKPEEVATDRSTVLYYRAFGPLTYDAEGTIDTTASPVATLFFPRPCRGALWTVGEIHFLASNMRRTFPGLNRTATELRRWLSSFQCVFEPGQPTQFAYYLEGSTRNADSPIYALPGGLDALNGGQYFVSDSESDGRIEALCGQLRLRGVECADV